MSDSTKHTAGLTNEEKRDAVVTAALDWFSERAIKDWSEAYLAHAIISMAKEVYGDRRTYGPGEETTANARLISAAPDLLEALIAAEQALEHAGSHLHADRCREVIAKATGAAA